VSTRKRRDPGQLPLDVAGSRRKGPVERATESDLRELRAADALGPALAGVSTVYRTLGRNVDRAEAMRDTWSVIGAARELRQFRAMLGDVVAADDDELDAALARVRAAIGDTPEP
jgi:predicted lipid-binding transport protein (Tim44 family)